MGMLIFDQGRFDLVDAEIHRIEPDFPQHAVLIRRLRQERDEVDVLLERASAILVATLDRGHAVAGGRGVSAPNRITEKLPRL